jgi:hypothetical protein
MREAMRRVARNIFGEEIYSEVINCSLNGGATKKHLLQVCYALQLVELKSLELNQKRFLESISIRLKTNVRTLPSALPAGFPFFPPTVANRNMWSQVRTKITGGKKFRPTICPNCSADFGFYEPREHTVWLLVAMNINTNIFF